MKFIFTFQEIIDNGNWEKFCELREYNPHFLNEGFSHSKQEINLTLDEVIQCNLIHYIKDIIR